MTVDHGADAVYLNLTDRPIEQGEELTEGVVVDYAAEGRVVAVKTVDASKRTDDQAALKRFSYRKLTEPVRREG